MAVDVESPAASLVDPLTSLGLLPPPGFSSIVIPLPPGSLYRNPPGPSPRVCSVPVVSPMTEPTPSSSIHRTFLRPRRKESNGAFTLLIVDDNVIHRKVLSKVCERWGQPYELAEDGQQAFEMYCQSPDRFRCILMDVVMPVLDGFQAAKKIRAFEDESWRSFLASSSMPPTSGRSGAAKPVRRAVIMALVPGYAAPGIRQRIVDAGFDLSVSHPLQIPKIANLLFSGPKINVVSLYGGVDEATLVEAGYPLQPGSWRVRATGEEAVGEMLDRVVA